MELLRFRSLDQVRQVNADSFLKWVILNTHTYAHIFTVRKTGAAPSCKMITAYTFFFFVLFFLLIKVTHRLCKNGTLLSCHLKNGVLTTYFKYTACTLQSNTRSAQPSLMLCTPPHHIMNMNMMGVFHQRIIIHLSTHKCCTAGGGCAKALNLKTCARFKLFWIK